MNGDLILIIPVLLIIVAIMFLVRHMRGGTDDSIAALIGIVPIVIIIGVAIGIIVSMASIVDPWEWDADSKTLTIDGNIHDTGLSYPWTGYATQVETLVIEPGVEFVQGPAFARMTNLEYVDIAEGVTLDDGAFSQTFKDPLDNDMAMADVPGFEYVAMEGVMYQCDPTIFTYNAPSTVVAGFATSGIKNVVLPREASGTALIAVGGNAFKDQTSISRLMAVPDMEMVSFYTSAFEGCTSLTDVSLPESMTGLGEKVFYGCTSLESVAMPETVTAMWASGFYGCTSLTSFDLPDRLSILGTGVFASCTQMTEFHFPATVTQIGAGCFSGCTGVTEVSFEEGFAPTLGNGCFGAWTFYASDATTVIDKTNPANLAGKTFQGTAAALVEVINGERSLTPDQIMKVRLHDAELERIKLEAISIGPLPFELQDA